MNRDFLSKAIDELPYSIKPTAFFAYKNELMQKASITDKGYSLFEKVFNMFDGYAKEHKIEIEDKTLTDYTLMLIYFATCKERRIEFDVKETPLCDYFIDLVMKYLSMKRAGVKSRMFC